MKLISKICNCIPSQDGRGVYGAAFRSQCTIVGVGSNPTSDKDNELK